MSDKLKQTLIDVTFAQGEQPDANKLNGAFGQMETAIEFINKAIGDINNQQYPHSDFSSPLSTLPSSGPSLGRLVGSANWLNPKRLGLIRKTITVEMGYKKGGAIVDEIDAGSAYYHTKYFRLPFPPVILTKNYTPGGSSRKTMGDLTVAYSWDGAPGSWTIAAPTGGTYTDGTAKVATRVTNFADLNANGEYLVTADGTIVLYQSLGSGPEGFKLTYTFDTIGDTFTGATLNVIPDFAQTTTLCTVADNGDGTYNVTLPTIEVLMGANFSGSGFSSTFGGPDFTLRSKDTDIFHPYDNTSGLTGSPSYNAQCYLPEIITANLSPNDTIPEGYIYIWDETTSQILNGGTFTYLSSTSVKVSGLSLVAGSNRYRVIVPGADIAHIVSNLRESYVRHNHDGRIDTDGIFRGERIRHPDLVCPNDQYGGWVASEWGPEVNPHPQYLTRWGWDTNDGGTTQGDGNFQNAMAGDILFAQMGTDYYYNDATIALTGDSFGVQFGNGSGPRLYYESSTDTLELSNKALTVDVAAPASPELNTLYKENIIKVKGRIETDATPQVTGGFNIDDVTYDGSNASYAKINFLTPIGTDYTPVVTNWSYYGFLYQFHVEVINTSYVEVSCYLMTNPAAPSLVNLGTTTLRFSIIIV